MKINNNSVFSLLIVLDVILTAAYPLVYGTVLESLLVYSIWGVSFFMLVSAFATSLKKGTSVDFFFLIFVGLSVVFSMLISPGSWVSSVTGCLSYFLMLIPIYYVRHLGIHERQISMIRKANGAKVLIFILLAISPYAYKAYYVNGYWISNGELTLGFSNPNILGMLLVNTFAVRMYFVAEQASIRNKRRKLINITSMMVLAYLVFLTRSRISIALVLAMLLFAALQTKGFTFMRRILQKKIIAVVACIAPLLFLGLFYELYYRTEGNLLIMGEDVFSRIILYNDAFASIKDHIIFGAVNLNKFHNMHNGILTVLANTGVVGLCVYLQFLCHAMLRYAKYIKHAQKPNLIPYAMVLLLCAQSCVEAGIVAGGPIIAVGIAIIYYLCEANKRK